ncbi:serine/arginine repetitive matrix protein 1-like [Pezoporus flaviventris]|uniref:serine/arginine repetitive matrix protein 1-like n=1 Tax=Pezoporus flaviventris TaxID=889875 RepID=UPI002AB28E88|nr:serine/arginine repetitive matrix protein 1-like [Pezoporus flaviventris]
MYMPRKPLGGGAAAADRRDGHGGDPHNPHPQLFFTEPSHTCLLLPAARSGTFPRSPSPRSQGSRRLSRLGDAAPPPPRAAPDFGPGPAPGRSCSAPRRSVGSPLPRRRDGGGIRRQERGWARQPAHAVATQKTSRERQRGRQPTRRRSTARRTGTSLFCRGRLCQPPPPPPSPPSFPLFLLPPALPSAFSLRPSRTISVGVCFTARAGCRIPPATNSGEPPAEGRDPKLRTDREKHRRRGKGQSRAQAGPDEAARRSPQVGSQPRAALAGQSDSAPRQLSAAPSPVPASRQSCCEAAGKVEENPKRLF